MTRYFEVDGLRFLDTQGRQQHDSPPADLEPLVSPGYAFGRGTELQVIPNSDENELPREALSRNEARRLGRPIAGYSQGRRIQNSTTLIPIGASEIGSGAAGS